MYDLGQSYPIAFYMDEGILHVTEKSSVSRREITIERSSPKNLCHLSTPIRF